MWSLITLALVAWCLLFRRTFIDDTFITLQYVRNLADHGQWGFYPDLPTNTATSPLNVLVLATITVFAGSPVIAVTIATALCLAASLWLLQGLSRVLTGSAVGGWLAFTLLLANPLMLSTLGLESHLSVVLLLGTTLALARGRWRLGGVALGLLAITRPEGVLLLGTALVVMPMSWRDRAGLLGCAALTAAPWYLFSWIRLGSVIPDTLLIKLEQEPWLGTTTFVNGPAMYLDHYRVETLLSIWPVVLAPLVLIPLRKASRLVRRGIMGLFLYAAAHYAGYSALGVPPFHWYYVPEVLAIVVAGGLGVGNLLIRVSRAPGMWSRLLTVPAIAAPILILLPLITGQGSALREALIHSNWGTPGQYRDIAAGIADQVPPGEAVEVRGEIGTLAFYSDRLLLDIFTDPVRTADAVDRLRADQSPLVGWLLDVNFLWRHDPRPAPVPAWVLEFAAPPEPATGDGVPTRSATWTSASSWVQGNRIALSRLPVPSAVAWTALPPGASEFRLSRLLDPVGAVSLQASALRRSAHYLDSRATTRCRRMPRRRRSARGAPQHRTRRSPGAAG
jgi:hypothetical protein